VLSLFLQLKNHSVEAGWFMGCAVVALTSRGFNHAEAQPIKAENNHYNLLQLIGNHTFYLTLIDTVCQYVSHDQIDDTPFLPYKYSREQLSPYRTPSSH
jgi:hypothetical protein